MQPTSLELEDPRGGDPLPALLVRPEAARALLVLAHGAGAGMRHSFMEAISGRLYERAVATLRYAFPYMARAKRAPDRPPVLQATVRAALELARREAGDLPIFAAGKSMGGRMSSLALAEGEASAQGIVFFGFPLHAAGKPATVRGDHLVDVPVPMLFLQGTRDKLADLELLRPICESLGDRATLHVVEGADHGFHVLKRSGRSDDEVLDELADATTRFASDVSRP